MGKGRWQHGAANCNHTEPNGQQPEPETQHELSEPCALQGARTVHRGGKCREAPTYLNCLCETREDAEQVQKILVEWLKERGLALSEEKTRIVHLTEGFDFLGFNIRHYPAPQTSRTGWKLLIKPSKESVQEVQKKLKGLWKRIQGTNAQVAVGRLNPVIRGWANYFRIAVAKEIFNGLDRWMFYKADHYTRRMHPRKSKDWRHQKYWGRLHLDRSDLWVFGDKQTGAYLLKFSWFPIERHPLVKGTSSPDDPRLKEYWTKRQAAK